MFTVGGMELFKRLTLIAEDERIIIAQSPWPMSSPVRAPPAGAALSITDQAKSPKPAMDRLNALTVAAQNPP